MSRKLRSLAALATVALIGAGCASTSAQTGTGNGGGNGGGTSDTTHGKAVKFAECIRNNGVSAFPDPDASGKLTIDEVANGSSIDPSAPAFKQALGACKDLEPSGFTGHERTPQEQQAALKFAQCVRANGVPDFPDPSPDGPLIDTNRIPSLAGKDPRTDPGLNASKDKCRAFAAAAGVTGQ
jgi:hypothetical protein